MFKLFIFTILIWTVLLVFSWPLVNKYLGFTYTVLGQSMEPNLKNKDYIFIQKNALLTINYKRGDIVVFKNPKNLDQMLIKRIVGLPGERLAIHDGYVYINENRLGEPYLPEGVLTAPDMGSYEISEVYIPKNSFYLLNDKRSDYYDSRQFDPIAKKDIIGKLMVRLY